MQIQTITQTDPLPATTAAADASSGNVSSAVSKTAALGDENTFLQLMVAQLKNQDPTQPVDSTAFLSQLAQFSSLEQLININQGVQTLETTASSGSTASTSPTSQNGTASIPVPAQ